MRGILACVCALATASLSVPAAQSSPEVRALWVVRTTMTSRASITSMVAAARDAGFNTLVVQVRGRGDAYYRSRVEPRARALAPAPQDFDPLSAVIEDARVAGLAVHAWVNVNLVADATDLPSAPNHVVRRHPEWLMLPRELVQTLGRVSPNDPRFLPRLASWTRGQSASVEGLFTSPSSAGAQDHLLNVVDDLVSHYPVDGVHFDYARYPGEQFDFRRETMTAFASSVAQRLSQAGKRELRKAAETNPFVYVDRYPSAWEDFRRQRLTSLVRRLGAAVHARRPSAIVSAAVVPDLAMARGQRGQDWAQWLELGLLDVVCPMAYTTDGDAFLRQMVAGRAAADGRRIWAGIGAYRLSVEQTLKHIGLARGAGADGVILFSYDSLTGADRSDDYLARVGRDAFGR